MTPVTCLGLTMIITGIVEFFLSRNEGFKKYKRNIIIYAVLSLVVLIFSQSIWDFAKSVSLEGFPYAGREGEIYDYLVQMPPRGASVGTHINYFLVLAIAGSNHPLFPYLIMAFVGNIVGILLVANDNKEQPNLKMPRQGIYAGLAIFFTGVILIPILGVDFDSILPVSAIGDITKIHGGTDGFWIPWWTFLLAGQVILLFFIIRMVEYRGKGKDFAEKTKFYRRFGMPAFSVYSWHRFAALPIMILLSMIMGRPTYETDAIYKFQLTEEGLGAVLFAIILIQIFIGYLLKFWEKTGYIGGIEWMMGSVGALFGSRMQKSKGTLKENPKWYEHGKMDPQKIFYNPRWIEIVQRNEEYHQSQKDSTFALKLSKLGLCCGIFAPIAFNIARKAKVLEGENPINTKALKLSQIGTVVFIAVVVFLNLVTLDTFGIAL